MTHYSSLLFDNPQFYDYVFPVESDDQARLCLEIVRRYATLPRSSVLDVGCGTARDLSYLAAYYRDCWGVDVSQKMVSHAARNYPNLSLCVGDMRAFRLGMQFDLITCMGSVFSYALTNKDIEDTLSTFAVHARPRSLIVLGMRNAAALIGTCEETRPLEFEVRHRNFEARAICNFRLDRPRQLLYRTRTWKREGECDVEDYCAYRLLFPLELTDRLNRSGFDVLGLFDNTNLVESDLTGSNLYVISQKIS